MASVISDRLRQARESAKLSPSQLAALLDVDDAKIAAAENGTDILDPEFLDGYARVFGMSVKRFLSGDPVEAPAPLLFRSLDAAAIHELQVDGAQHTLGQFFRFAEDIHELAERRAKHDISPSAPWSALTGLLSSVPDNDEALYRETEEIAAEVRVRLKLGEGAIPSMIRVFEKQLEVPIFWVTPDEIDANIDGACTRAPTPAVMVNLVGGAERWWRTRMTLAHELCHLILDALPQSTRHRMAMFSPRRELTARRAYQLPAELERMEKRANVFAAHFVAPGREIRALIQKSDATSETAITLVCKHFQVGRTTAINQLRNVFLLSKQERAEMLARPSRESLADDHPDADVPRTRSPRSAVWHRWVEEALMSGWIGAVRARDYLGYSLTESLPGAALPADLRRPFRTEAESVQLRMYAFLGSNALSAGWQVDKPVRDGAVWRATAFDVDPTGKRMVCATVVASTSHPSIVALQQ